MFKSKHFVFILISINILGIFGSWLTSCKPCLEVLNRCNECKNYDECKICFDGICPQCLNDVFNFGNSNFYCDTLISYHNASCSYYCKPSNALSGYCDFYNGICKCITTDSTDFPITSTTTTETELTTPIEITELVTSEQPTAEQITSEEPATSVAELTNNEEPTTTTTLTTTKLASTLATTTKWNSNSWKTSCLPCTDILEECSTCLKSGCYTWYVKLCIINKKY